MATYLMIREQLLQAIRGEHHAALLMEKRIRAAGLEIPQRGPLQTWQELQSFYMISRQLRVFWPPQARTASPRLADGIRSTEIMFYEFLPAVFTRFEGQGVHRYS